MAYLGFQNIADIECMTLAEYYLRIEAYQLQQAQIQGQLALQAWFNQAVQATKGTGKKPKPQYKKFKDFYDIEQVNADIRATFEGGTTKKREQLNENELIARRYNEWQKIQAQRKHNKQKKGGKT